MGKYVNEKGREEIRQWLGENYRKAVESGEGGDYFTESMIDAWVEDANISLDAGNPPWIEVRAAYSHSRVTEVFEVSAEGISDDELK